MIFFNIKTIKAHLTCAFIVIYIVSSAQKNLVPNYSFENYSSCPGNGIIPIILADPWVTVKGGSTECQYANSCSKDICCAVPYTVGGASYQYAHTGNAYAGMFYIDIYGHNLHSYLQTKLSDSMLNGHCYYVEYFVNNVDCDIIACNNISLFLSDTAISIPANGKYIPASPQVEQYGNPVIKDTMNWVKVAGVYTSHGGEKYITLGNFKDDIHTDTINFQKTGRHTATYNIDDVSVIPLDSMQLKAEAGRDTTIVKGDSVWIGSRLCGLTNVVWYDASNNVIDTGAPGLWVKPTNNTFYVIEQDVCGQYSRDTVFVNVQPLPVSMLNFECLMLNERQVKVSWQTATEINVSHFNVQRSIDGVTFETIGKVNVKGASTYNFNDPLTTHDSRFTTLYYRLEIVDKNGALSYSDIKELSIINSSLSITPNPAKDYITINGGNIKEVRISDVSGRVLLVGNTKKVDVRGLVSGVYYVAIETLNGNHAIYKFVKL